MPSAVVSTLIHASLDEVWRAIADLSSHAGWMADAESITFETDQESGVGTRMQVRTRIGPLATTDLIEVTEWVPRQAIGVVHRGVVRGIGRFELAPLAGGTRLTWSETLRFPLWAGGPVTAWLARPVLAWVWRRNLARLSQQLERGHLS